LQNIKKPKNQNMLLPRIITAILGIPIVLICVYYGGGLFFVLLLLILLYMIKEYTYMTNVAGYEVGWFFPFLVGVITFFSIIFEPLQFNKHSLYLTSIVLTILLFIMFFKEIIKQKPIGSIGRISVSFLGPFLFSWSMAHFYLVRDIKNYGMQLTYILIFTIWTADNASYIFGSIFGKKKLASIISPKKTIVGLFSGIIFGFLGFLFFNRIFMIDQVLSYKELSILGLILPILTVISDLSESLIKRDCGFKDSDNLLVGHGGMMDRFDSFIFTTPSYYYLLLLFLKK